MRSDRVNNYGRSPFLYCGESVDENNTNNLKPIVKSTIIKKHNQYLDVLAKQVEKKNRLSFGRDFTLDFEVIFDGVAGVFW